MVKRRFHCKLDQVIQTFYRVQVVEMGRWGGGELQERKTRSVQQRKTRGSQGQRDGGHVLAPEGRCCCGWGAVQEMLLFISVIQNGRKY